MTGFQWTEQKEKAATLLAQDDLTDVEIAERVAVSPRALYQWKARSEFRERVTSNVEALRQAALSVGIADKARRMRRLDRDWRRLQRVMDERAESLEMQDAPGGQTGTLVRQIRGIGRGEDFQLVEEFAVDTGLLAELRQIEKQAAQEMGQWVDRQELSTDEDKPFVMVLRGVSVKDFGCGEP